MRRFWGETDTTRTRGSSARVLPWPARRWHRTGLFLSAPSLLPAAPHSTFLHSSHCSPRRRRRSHCSRAARTRARPAPSPRRRRATQPRPPGLRTRRPDLGRIRSVLSSPGCGRPGRAMDWPGTSPEGPGRAARPHAGSGSSSSRSDLHRRWSAGRYTNGGRPGSVLAQKLAGAPLPLIKCDHCPRMVVRRVSTTPEHPGWVFIKCLNDGVCAFFSFGLCSRFD